MCKGRSIVFHGCKSDKRGNIRVTGTECCMSNEYSHAYLCLVGISPVSANDETGVRQAAMDITTDRGFNLYLGWSTKCISCYSPGGAVQAASQLRCSFASKLRSWR